MRFAEYKKLVAELNTGKVLNDATYIHVEALQEIAPQLSVFIEDVASAWRITNGYSVLKFFRSSFKLSFLYYMDFYIVPHPLLKRSITIYLYTGKMRNVDYSNSVNPPILHRKEHLICTNHTRYEDYANLTKTEEASGLYENPNTIGLLKNWKKLLAQKGVTYKDHELIQN